MKAENDGPILNALPESSEARGYDSDIPRHQKRASGKPHKLECRLPANNVRNQRFNFWKDWSRKSAYRTRAQAEQAMRDMKQKPFWSDFQWRVTSES